MNKITTLKEYQDLLSTPGIHIIKVSAQWCNQCKALTNLIYELKDELQVRFVEVDADEAEEELIDLLNVRNIPLLIYYKDGKEYNRQVGINWEETYKLICNDS